MHELSIAVAIMDGVLEESERRGGVAVKAVRVRVGRMSGVDSDALRFAYEVAVQDSPLASSSLEIEEVAAVVFCPACAGERECGQILLCPSCGSAATRLVRGGELEIESLEIIDEPRAAAG